MKKTLSCLILFLCMGCGVYAQTSGWEAGTTLSGGYSMNLVTHVSSAGKPFADNIKANGRPAWSYSAGVYGRKFFNDRYGIEVGLQYTSFGLANKGIYTPITPSGQPDPMFNNSNEPMDIKKNYQYNYLELPVRFVFKKELSSKFGIGCFVGMAPALLTYVSLRNVMERKEDDFRLVSKGSATGLSNRFNLFADVGLLLRANITPHFCLDLKPHFRATVLPRHTKKTSPDYEERFLVAGITVSSVWKF